MATPIYNLEITRDSERACIGRCKDNTSLFIGEFILHDTGELVRGRDQNLHITKADISYYSGHIHLEGGARIIDIIQKHGTPYLVSRFRSEPRFRLEAFYSTRRHSPPGKECLLLQEIKKFKSDFEFNSIATNDRTRVKLLENSYKKYVSDQ